MVRRADKYVTLHKIDGGKNDCMPAEITRLLIRSAETVIIQFSSMVHRIVTFSDSFRPVLVFAPGNHIAAPKIDEISMTLLLRITTLHFCKE